MTHYDHTEACERLFDLMAREADPIQRPEPIRPQPPIGVPPSWQRVFGAFIGAPWLDVGLTSTETPPESPVLDAEHGPAPLQPQP